MTGWMRYLSSAFLAVALGVAATAAAGAKDDDNLWDRAEQKAVNEEIGDHGAKVENTHFRVFYRPSQTTAAYARFVANAIATSRRRIVQNMGYKEPDWLGSTKLDVYIKDTTKFNAAGLATGIIRRKNLGIEWGVKEAAWVEIDLEKHIRSSLAGGGGLWHSVKAIVAHEYFHVVQFGYDQKERPWLMEATATWVEDKVFPLPERYWHLTGPRQRIGNWEYRRPFVSSFSVHEYASSLFFQYLTERRPGGREIVRRIWEEAAKQPGNSTYKALASVLGDAEPWGPKTRNIVGDFAATMFIRDPKRSNTYSLRKLKGVPIPTVYLDDLRLNDIAFDKLTRRKVRPKTLELTPFQIGYYEILPPYGSLYDDKAVKRQINLGRLILELSGDKPERWEFRLIEMPREGAESADWRVRRFPKRTDRHSWNRLVVENYPKKRLVLVAVNFLPTLADLDICAAKDKYAYRGKRYNKCKMHDITPKAKFKIAAAFFKPPVIKSFIVEYSAKTRDPDFRKVWKIVREKTKDYAGRIIWRTRNPLTEGVRYKGRFEFGQIRIVLETNTPVSSILELKLAGREFKMYADGFAGRGGYDTKFSRSIFISDLAGKLIDLRTGRKQTVFLPVRITGRDSWGAAFDVRPRTAPVFKVKGPADLRIENWDGNAAVIGGTASLGNRAVPFHKRAPAAHLARIAVHQGADRIYQAEWKPDPDEKREGRRQLARKKSKPFDPKQPLSIDLTFDTPVKDVVVALAASGSRLPANSVKVSLPNADKPKSDYQAKFAPSPEIEKLLKKNNRLSIFVSAATENGLKLDGDPRTAAWYDYDDKRWYWLEEDKEIIGKGQGGPDRWHTLNARGRSIMLVLDASGSMEKQMPNAKQGIVEAVRTLRPGDEVALVVFGGCGGVRLAVPFTGNPEDVVKVLPAISPGGGTPLGEAVAFAKNYMAQNAGFPNPKLMVFTDGEDNCGSNVKAIVTRNKDPKPKPNDEPVDDKPEKIRWTAYKVEAVPSRYFPRWRIIEIEYYEEKGKRPLARLTMRRYPISTMSARGRTVWSINWSNRKVTDRRQARGGEVDSLRARAESARQGTMARSRLRQAVQAAIGPGAVALSRR